MISSKLAKETKEGARSAMTEKSGESIKVVLQWLQILDNLEPIFKEKGEFRFRSKVWGERENGTKILQQTQFPEKGYWSISDHPAWNKKDKLDRVVFEGEVDEHLVVEFFGEELDTFSANDQLDHYQREFRGPVKGWLGRYGPGEDLPEDVPSDDPESMTNWRICYIIERA
jgi:hypothetical protein